MKRAIVLLVVSLLLFSLVSAKIGMTSRATDNLNDSEEDNRVCCSTLVIVPDAVPSYEWRDAKNCDNIGDNGEELVGANNMIVKNSFCQNNEDETETCEAWTCTQWSACLNGIKTRNCVPNSNCSAVQETPKTSKTCEAKEKINVHQKQSECPEECTCTGSVTKCTLANGTREMTIHAGKSGNIIVQVRGINMTTNVTLYKSDDGKLYGVFKNNETKQVKMLPDQVKEKVKEKLARQLESESITLNDNGTYNYQGKENAKLFAFIPVKVMVRAELNPQTGEVIKLNKAWWAVFTKEDAGGMIVGASCGTVSPDSRNECCVNKGYDAWNADKAECEFNSSSD